MGDYHDYVFDAKRREFVGAFDEMYRQESVGNFDSWHQEDSRQLNRKIALSIIELFNFCTIVDVGCGKGALTHLLKKRNNQVLGLDVSQTAVETASARFPDIGFRQFDVKSSEAFGELVSREFGKADLIFTAECLSYLENWKTLLKAFSLAANYLLVCLYIPENPIGFVKSADDLEQEMYKHFDVIESVRLRRSNFTIIFGKSNAIQNSV